MLTRAQERMVRRYVLFSGIMAPAILMGMLAVIIQIILVAINGAFLHDAAPPDVFFMCSMIAVFVFYCIVAGYARCSVIRGMHRSEKWRDVVGTVVVENGAVQDSQEYWQEICDLEGDPQAVAQQAQVGLRRVVWYKAALIWLPITLMCACTLPRLANSWHIMQEEKAAALAVLEQLNETFASKGLDTMYDDPMDDYYASGYTFHAYLPDTEAISGRNISIQVTNAGKVKSVSYHCDVNDAASKEEHIKAAQEGMKELHDILLLSDLSIMEKPLTEIYDFPEEFWQAFREGSYYEEISIDQKFSEDRTIFYSFHTDPKDDLFRTSFLQLYMVNYDTPKRLAGA